MRRLIFDIEHEEFRASARRFFEGEVAPHAEGWRKQGYVDREAYLKAGAQGYLLPWAEERYGGSGITDFRYEQILIEENLRYGEPGFYLHLHSGLVAPYIGKLGSEEQKARWLPGCVQGSSILAIAMTEPGCGSDLAGMRTRAEDKGDHWLLTGSKTYISNGQIADLIIVAARTDPERKHGLALLVVESRMQGFRRGQRLPKMGLAAQDTSELFFDGVQVPKANVLGDATSGFKYLVRFLPTERLIAAAGSMAAAQTAFDLTLEFVKTRRAFGRPIGAMQNTRFVMADLRARLDAVQTFVDQCVLLLNDGALTAQLASEAKLLASELEGVVTDHCVQLHGGAGYMAEYRISRLYSDARVTRIFAGTSEIMKEIIGRSLGLDERKLI
jgi:alkylation response protein AidB-like acyl-CoA dehydrogenase